MKAIQEAVKARLPSILVAAASVAAVAGIEFTQVELDATVNTVVEALAALSTAYAGAMVAWDRVVARFDGKE